MGVDEYTKMVQAKVAGVIKQKQPTAGAIATLSDVDVDVYATWNRGFHGDREQPAEPAGYVIDRVMFRGVDVTDLCDLADIASQINDDFGPEAA